MRRSFRRRPSLAALAAVLLALLACLRLAVPWLLAEAGFWPAAPRRSPALFAEGPCRVLAVQPGGVLFIEQQRPDPSGRLQRVQGKLRLLGIRLPKNSPTAAARDFAAALVRRGPQAIRLDKRRLDEKGRFLAYVEVSGQTLNVELVRAGLAMADCRPGDSATMSRQLGSAEREAQQAGRGIWAKGARPESAGR